MAKASPATFADAKRRALRALGQQMPDGFVPDRIMFFNDDLGFIVRVSNLSDDRHAQRLISWVEIDAARFPIVEKSVSLAVETLARADARLIKKSTERP